jgi:signal transduction histidine kinase
MASMNFSLPARSAFLGMIATFFCVLLFGAAIIVYGLKKDLQETASRQEAHTVVSSLESTLNNDLLNSNFDSAMDRIHALVNSDLQNTMCVRVLDQAGSQIFIKDAGGICSIPEAEQIESSIYFDLERTRLAYLIEVKFLPRTIPLETRSYAILLSSLLFALLFICLGLAGRVFSWVFEQTSLIHAGRVTFPSLAGVRFTELDLMSETHVEMQRREKKYRQAQILEERNKASAELAEQVAHDIRAPLASLKAAVADLQGIPSDTKELVEAATRRITAIANGLLSKKKALSEPGSALRVVEAIVAEKRKLLNRHCSILCLWDLTSEELDCSVPSTLEFGRLISNLLENALDALEGGPGEVRIEVQNSTENYVRIQVTDSGKGITPEVLHRLTERGFTHGKENGTGLGLFHARELLVNWGGRIEIQSRVGVGTCVSIFLPRHPLPGRGLSVAPEPHAAM